MKVKIKYKSWWIPFYRTFYFPAKLQEYTPRQFVEFVRYFNEEDFSEEAQIKCLQNLLGISSKLYYKLDSEQVLYLLNLFNKSYKDSNITMMIIPQLTVGGVDLICPNDMFMDITFGEFILADEYYLEYVKTKNIDNVNYIINALYCEKNTNRKSHTENLVFWQKVLKFKMIDDKIKAAIVFNYGLIRNRIEELYPAVFKASEDAAPQESSETCGWKNILFSLSADLTKVEKVEMQNLHYSLSWLNEKIIELRKNKEQ